MQPGVNCVLLRKCVRQKCFISMQPSAKKRPLNWDACSEMQSYAFLWLQILLSGQKHQKHTEQHKKPQNTAKDKTIIHEKSKQLSLTPKKHQKMIKITFFIALCQIVFLQNFQKLNKNDCLEKI